MYTHTYIYIYHSAIDGYALFILNYIKIIYKGISLHSGVMTFQLGVEGGACRFPAAPCSPLFWIKNDTVATAPYRRPGYVGLTYSRSLLTWLHFTQLAGFHSESSMALFNCKAMWALGLLELS